MPGFRFGETVTLITRTVTGKDAYGNDVTTDAETIWPGTVYSPAGSTENLSGQDTIDSQAWFAWKDVWPDLSAVDAIRRPNGEEYELTGDPMDFVPTMTPTGILQAHANRKI